MKSALFLGAGASVFASMPTTKGLLDLVRNRVRERAGEPQRNPNHQYVMRVIEDGAYSDIEQLYDGMETVINTAGKDNCRPIVGEMVDPVGIKYDQAIRELMDLRLAVRNILLESFRINTAMLDPIKHVYDNVRATMRQDRTDRPVPVRRKRREEEFLVFTTNYDLVMEEYGRRAGFEIVNGFKPAGYLDRIWDDKWRHDAERLMYLVKLHGSVNWWRDADGDIQETGGIEGRDADHDILIAPTEGGKRYDEKPFDSLMGRFERKIGEVDALFVVGFSYRDDKIVRIIRDRVNSGMYLISLSPTATEDIRRVAVDGPMDVVTDDLRIRTLGPRIIVCDVEFGPDTLERVLASLEIAYSIIRDREHSTA